MYGFDVENKILTAPYSEAPYTPFQAPPSLHLFHEHLHSHSPLPPPPPPPLPPPPPPVHHFIENHCKHGYDTSSKLQNRKKRS